MKQDAANHWKIQGLGKAVAKRLGGSNLGGGGLTPELARRTAMGMMESLWIWAKRYYPRGDIGRATDEAIAIEAGWEPEDARWLIDTLCQLRLIDAHKRCRFIVHDLSEHAEDHVRKVLERAGFTTFADGQPVRRDGPGRPRKEGLPNPPEYSPPAEDRREKSRPALAEPKPEPPPSRSLSQRPSQAAAEPEPLPRAAAVQAHPPRPVAEMAADLLRRREADRAKRAAGGIGSAVTAVGRPEHAAIVQALRTVWPQPDPAPEELAQHENASLERVWYLVEKAHEQLKAGTLRNGRRGMGGYVRRGIENAYEVPADWLASKHAKLEALRGQAVPA